MAEPTISPGPLSSPVLGSTADQIPYVPVSWLAVGAATVAGLLAVLLLFLGINSFRWHRPLLQEELLMLAVLAMILSFAARRHRVLRGLRLQLPVRFMNGSITSSGNPNGYVGIACGVTTPISSQWPVVVSLPFDRSSSRPATAGAPGCGAQPSSGSMFPNPRASSVGRSRPPTARATFASVFEPASPNSAASGSSPPRRRPERSRRRGQPSAAILLPWQTCSGSSGSSSSSSA